MKIGTLENTKIESLAYRGEGIGHIENKVIFVPFTAPGDQVQVKISENKRNYLRGSLEHFVSRSPDRIVPLCDYFGTCGGCHWQHLNYEHQLEAKEKILRETMTRIGKVKPDHYELLTAIPSPKPFGYRSRIRLQCFTQRKISIGFFRSHSNDVIPVERCELVSCFVNSLLKKLTEFLNSLDFFPHFSEVEIFANPVMEEATLSFKNSSPMDDEKTKDFLKALKVSIPKVYGVSIENVQDEETKIEHFGNCGLPFEFSFTPSGGGEPVTIKERTRIHTFRQVNIEQNQNLRQLIYEWAEPDQEKVVVDLFCGSGNLGLPLAGTVRQIIGLENNPLAVEDAQENARLNGFENCMFRATNVFSDLDELKDLERVDLVILDPPRKGAKECIGKIAALKPAKILYVSCNPTTLARDASLFAYSRYRLQRVQLLDMFPQTYHIECLAEFEPQS